MRRKIRPGRGPRVVPVRMEAAAGSVTEGGRRLGTGRSPEMPPQRPRAEGAGNGPPGGLAVQSGGICVAAAGTGSVSEPVRSRRLSCSCWAPSCGF